MQKIEYGKPLTESIRTFVTLVVKKPVDETVWLCDHLLCPARSLSPLGAKLAEDASGMPNTLLEMGNQDVLVGRMCLRTRVTYTGRCDGNTQRVCEHMHRARPAAERRNLLWDAINLA